MTSLTCVRTRPTYWSICAWFCSYTLGSENSATTARMTSVRPLNQEPRYVRHHRRHPNWGKWAILRKTYTQTNTIITHEERRWRGDLTALHKLTNGLDKSVRSNMVVTWGKSGLRDTVSPAYITRSYHVHFIKWISDRQIAMESHLRITHKGQTGFEAARQTDSPWQSPRDPPQGRVAWVLRQWSWSASQWRLWPRAPCLLAGWCPSPGCSWNTHTHTHISLCL